jgi:hypothetical protein
MICRCNETVHLRRKHFMFDQVTPDADQALFFGVNLEDRKGWQRKADEGSDARINGEQ